MSLVLSAGQVISGVQYSAERKYGRSVVYKHHMGFYSLFRWYFLYQELYLPTQVLLQSHTLSASSCFFIKQSKQSRDCAKQIEIKKMFLIVKNGLADGFFLQHFPELRSHCLGEDFGPSSSQQQAAILRGNLTEISHLLLKYFTHLLTDWMAKLKKNFQIFLQLLLLTISVLRVKIKHFPFHSQVLQV